MAKKIGFSISELQYISISDLLAYTVFYVDIENSSNAKRECATTPKELEAMLNG